MTTNYTLTGSSLNLTKVLKDHSLGKLIGRTPCVVGSPPYNCGIDYPNGYEDRVSWAVYNAWATRWARQIHDVLCPGGRAWVNVSPAVPHTPGDNTAGRVNLALLWAVALQNAGLQYRDTVTWVQDSWDGQCAWGSWLQPTAPNLRGSSELILLYYKETWSRPVLKHKGRKMEREDLGGDWSDLCRNVWKMDPAKGKGAPFPIELPARAIRLSTWEDEWVLDPWGGTGTTGEAAKKLGRNSVLVDVG